MSSTASNLMYDLFKVEFYRGEEGAPSDVFVIAKEPEHAMYLAKADRLSKGQQEHGMLVTEHVWTIHNKETLEKFRDELSQGYPRILSLGQLP